jgi:hypothetical protein
MSSYTPVGDGGLLVDTGDDGRMEASFSALTGSTKDFEAWRRFYAMTSRVAERTFSTLTEPLVSREDLRARVDDPRAWDALFERPIGETLTGMFGDDTVRGVPRQRKLRAAGDRLRGGRRGPDSVSATV